VRNEEPAKKKKRWRIGGDVRFEPESSMEGPEMGEERELAGGNVPA